MAMIGELLHIHIAESAGQPMRELERATMVEGVGIEGDRYATGLGYYSSKPDVRDVTLIEVETLEALARDHDLILEPSEHRRNLTTRGIPLNHLVGQRFHVGGVVLEGGRLNTPCAYLDDLVGKKVFRHLVHRSGLNCRIISGGVIAPGNEIAVVAG